VEGRREGELSVVGGTVSHAASNRQPTSASWPTPPRSCRFPKTVTLKDAADFTLIGKPLKRLDSPVKVNGQALFGIDARLPNMGIAAVMASPVTGGKVAAVDEQEGDGGQGRAPGAAHRRARWRWWRQLLDREAGPGGAAPRFDDGPNAGVSTASIVADMAKASEGTGHRHQQGRCAEGAGPKAGAASTPSTSCPSWRTRPWSR
jgi:isoquinoline 1-oxidoreductase beta subunit